MKFVDKTRAMLRLLVQGSERETVSEEAKLEVAALREERQKVRDGMDALLADLVRARGERLARP